MVVVPCAPFDFLLAVSLHLPRVGFSGSPAIQVAVLAKKFGAAVVTPEHRYYGKSPFREPHRRESEVPVVQASSVRLGRLPPVLSGCVDFLLADSLRDDVSCPTVSLPILAVFFKESMNAGYNRTGFDNPWFVFGVSYAGALSAWFRLKFPHLTWGSLASSGVVLAVRLESWLVPSANLHFRRQLNWLRSSFSLIAAR